MPRPSISWVITDPHFFHEYIVEVTNRPKNQEEVIIKWLKYFLAKQDILYILGDLIFYRHKELKGMLDSVPGKKILLMGNHDKKSRGWYMSNGIDFACDMLVVGGVLLSHKPIQNLPSGVRLNLHGHFHEMDHRKVPDWYDDKVHRLLSLEKQKMKPVKLEVFTRPEDGLL